ncbi:MAG TPA: hypothetical protein VNJ53_05220 [Gaiellaceae bacterium]|nr:hypothetical protein [Gaiellaceae bacterium]
MRPLLAVVLAAALALFGVEAGSTTPAQSPILASYRLAATLDVSLFVGWSRESGDDTPCTVWTRESGTNRVVARSVKPLQGSATIYRPGTTSVMLGGRSVPVPWATLQAVGQARGTVTRTVSQTSGVNRGCPAGSSARPRRFPPLECGERTFSSRVASLLGTDRVFDRTLDPGNTRRLGEPLSRLYKSSIDVNVSPGRDPFRRCDVAPSWAKRFPTDVGLAHSTRAGGRATGGRSRT